MMPEEYAREARATVISAINSPLGFFVLCLLIVEVFIATILIGTQDQFHKGDVGNFVYLGVSIFVLVILVVSALVLLRPESLILTEYGLLRRELAQLKDRFDTSDEVQHSLREALFYRGQKNYRRAEAAYLKALALDRDNDEAEVGLAVTKSLENPDDFVEAIRILDRVIERNPRYASAYYNRACLRCVDKKKNWGKKWLDDLSKTFELDSLYKEYALTDTDFDEVRDSKEFKKALA